MMKNKGIKNKSTTETKTPAHMQRKAGSLGSTKIKGRSNIKVSGSAQRQK